MLKLNEQHDIKIPSSAMNILKLLNGRSLQKDLQAFMQRTFCAPDILKRLERLDWHHINYRIKMITPDMFNHQLNLDDLLLLMYFLDLSERVDKTIDKIALYGKIDNDEKQTYRIMYLRQKHLLILHKNNEFEVWDDLKNMAPVEQVLDYILNKHMNESNEPIIKDYCIMLECFISMICD